MPLTVNITDHWSDGKRIHVTGNLVANGNYVTGGDTLNFGLPLIKSNSAPVFAEVQGFGGFDYFVVLGTNLNNSKLKVVTSSTGAELAQAAYPAGITGNPPNFYAIFPKLI